jgi:hypothetical protein
MKTSYKYLLGTVAVIGAVVLYKKYNKNEVVASSKAKISTDENAPISEDEKSEFLGFGRVTKQAESKNYKPDSWAKINNKWVWINSKGKPV